MAGDLLLEDVRLDDGTQHGTAAITVHDGRIASIGPAPEEWTGPRVAGAGRLVLPSFVDGHAHLDKTLWGLEWRPHTAGPGLQALIANEQRARTELPPVEDRAATLLQTYLDTGTTRIRSHVDVDPAQGLRAVEGVLAAAARFAGRIDVQVVAFPQSGLLTAPGTAELLEAAVRAGAHLVGGIDPAGVDRDPVAHVGTIFDIAERHHRGVDLHLHDRGSLGRWQLELVVDRTLAADMGGHVTVSHAFCLCDGDPAVPPLLERLAAAGIMLTTVAPGNVGPLPLARLRDLGVPVALGQDGVRDLWSPWGDADMLRRTRQLARQLGHRNDEDIAACLDLATGAGARVFGVEDHGLRVGARADLVLVDAAAVAHAVVDVPPREVVVARGTVVAGGPAG